MDIQSLSFGLKDAIALVVFTGGVLSFIYGMRRANDKNAEQNRETKKAAEDVKTEFEKYKIDTHTETEKKEAQIYARITEVKAEHQQDYSVITNKLAEMTKSIAEMNQKLAELLGFMKGRSRK